MIHIFFPEPLWERWGPRSAIVYIVVSVSHNDSNHHADQSSQHLAYKTLKVPQKKLGTSGKAESKMLQFKKGSAEFVDFF